MHVSGLIALICTCSGVVGFASFVWSVMKKAHQSTVKAVVNEIAERTKQLEHNGGSSMRDDVAVIRQNQQQQGSAILAHGEQLAAVVEAVHAINGRLDAMAQNPTTNKEV